MADIIKVSYPKNYLDDVNSSIEQYDDELAKLTSDSFANASTTNTLKHIKSALAKSLRKNYRIKDKEELTKKVNDILAIHGLADSNFDPINTISKYMTTQLNDVSIDDNGNKDDNKAIKGMIKEAELPFDKLIGYDYLYRIMKELYGKEEAVRISGEMYDFSLALHDSTKIMLNYCWALDSSKLVISGRPFGMLQSKPAKSVDSYMDCLCDSIPEFANHVAGAVAVATIFQDISHLLIYKQRIPLKDIKEDKKIRKYLENRFQKFIHSVNHPFRDSIESCFTNVSIFDKEKLHNFISEENYGWYFPKHIKVLADNELGGDSGKVSQEEFENFVVDYIFEVQKIFIDFFDKGDPSQNGMQYRFPVVTINMSKHWNEEKQQYELDKDNELLNYIVKKDIARYNLFTSEGTKICSCCFAGDEVLKIYTKDNEEIILTIKDFVEKYQKTPGQKTELDEFYIDSLTSDNIIEKSKITGVLLKKNNTKELIRIEIDENKVIRVTPDHILRVMDKETNEIKEITAKEFSEQFDRYLLPVL